MKKFIGVVVTMAMLAIPTVGLAKKAKWEQIKMENDYKIYEFEVIGEVFRYRIDPQTCLCCLDKGGGGYTIIDCQKLAGYSELKPYIEQCR